MPRIKRVVALKKFLPLQIAALIVAGLFMTVPALAHHSQSEFDFQSSVTLEGTVSKLEWKSPHARLYVDVVDDNGATVSWNFELPSPNTLMRRGWTRKSILAGDKVTVTGIIARNFPTIGLLRTVLDAEGQPLFTGSTPIK